MSWLNRVRKALPFQDKRDTPDNLWIKCPSCSEMLFTKEYEENLSVCPRCEHHGRIGAERRFAQLLDPIFTVLPESTTVAAFGAMDTTRPWATDSENSFTAET